jgi:RHS repeat-associated protein
VGTLSGSGVIEANGGGVGGTGWTEDGGGGGRVAMYYNDASNFNTANITAVGGGVDSGGVSGAVGTVYLKQNNGEGALLIDSYGAPTGAWTPLGQGTDTKFDVDQLVVSGTGVVAAPEHQMAVVANSVTLSDGAELTTQATTTAQEFSLQMTISGTLTVDATSSIDVSGDGYLPGYTVGNTTVGGATGSAGGSYGGLGGGASNATYDNYANPDELGSGAGTSGYAGSGGGMVQITAATAQIDGAIRANGGGGVPNYINGGGSGGGILLNVGTLSGSGVIEANGGGVGGTGWTGGGGGGGRVAVYYNDASNFNTANIAAVGGSVDSGGVSGAVGTVYLKQNNGEGVLLIDSYGAPTGAWTPLGQGTDTKFDVDQLVVSGAGVVAAPEHQIAIVANSVTLSDGAELTTQATTPSQEYSLLMTIADGLVIDSTSSIDVSGDGYLPGYTVGDTTQGGATGAAGGGYGGLGGGASNATYGDYANPDELGSGAGTSGYAGSGGGLLQITAATAQIDGAIRANGGGGAQGYIDGGGSGGGILLNVGTLSGSGVIEADGGAGGTGWAGVGGGGGGRVAVYTWSANGMSLPTANVTANGGSASAGNGSVSGAAGTVDIATTPYYTWEDTGTLFHGTEPISWLTLGLDPSQVTADITAYLGQQAFPIAVNQPVQGSLSWNTTTVPDGQYDLRAVFHDAAGNVVGQLDKTVCVNNTAAWYSGIITSNETWTSSQVNVVYGPLTVAAGVTVTIQPGAIVKFADGTGITIQNGAVLDASQATQGSPIILTSLEDDTAGGDTNMDGDKTLPAAGDWDGIAIQGNGTFLTNAYTDLRYLVNTESGTLSSSQAWLGTFVYQVTGVLTVPAGVTLTLNPGAIVKFDSGAGIDVQSGGQLVADGTVAQPIIFTSIDDNSVGGDTSGHGNASPAPGDWGMITVEGTATFDHAQVLYGSNGSDPNNTGAILLDNPAARVTFNDGIIAHSFYDGLYDNSGTINAANDLLLDNDRAVTGHSGTVSIVNCTLDGNVQGIVGHGETVTVVNTLITNSSEWGVYNYGTQPAIGYSDVYSTVSGSVDYEGMTDPTGTGGNISANPNYVNAAQGDYQLNYLSPAIDSGNATVAPATDMMGDPLYNDPRTTIKTGVRNASGVYADMGAYNFVELETSDLDMTVTSVTGPAAATAGGQAAIQWTDANIGSGTVVGPWHDSIYLVSNPGPYQTEILAGQFLEGQGVTLGPGQSTTASATIRVPGDVAGTHYWAVQTNSAGDIFVGQNMANDTLVSSAPVTLSVPALPIDGAAVSGQFTAAGQQQWYEFTPQAGQDIQVSLKLADIKGAAELYIGCGYMPSPQQYDDTQPQWNSASVTALAADTSGLTYYVLAEPSSLSGAMSNFTIQAASLHFGVTSVSPSTVGNGGPVTLALQGGGLSQSDIYMVVGPDGNSHTAAAVYMTNSSLVSATFDMTSLPAGAYKVVVETSNRGLEATLPNAFTVENTMASSNEQPQLVQSSLVAPSAIRAGQTCQLQVSYDNPGPDDAQAPILMLSGSGVSFELPGQSSFSDGSIELFAGSHIGPAGILPPGYKGTITVLAKADSITATSLNVQLNEVPPYVPVPPAAVVSRGPVVIGAVRPAAGGADTDYPGWMSLPIDWSSQEGSLQPPGMSDQAWNATFNNFTAAVGSNTESFTTAIDADANYLSSLGVYTSDPSDLMAFEMEKDGGFGAYQQETTLGAMGYGMPDPNVVATTDTSGNVNIESGGTIETFTLQSGGAYLAAPGDYSTLALVGGVYQLTESDGTLEVFNINGTLNYIQSTDGDRATYNYTGGHLTSISDAFTGQRTTYSYNANGRITQITDPQGRVTTLTYDSTDQYLTSITNAQGATTFTYVNSSMPVIKTVGSITYPDGSELNFTYDSGGHVSTVSGNGGADPVTYSYNQGEISQSDALGDTSSVYLDEYGDPVKYVDALGNVATAAFDGNLNLTSFTLPGQLAMRAAYDALGNATNSTDPLGQQTHATYNAYSELTSLTDPRGNTTAYAYNSAGEMTGITYADGTSDQYAYDAVGNVTQSADADGNAIKYTYNQDGLVTSETLADGTEYTYAYDSHDNMTSATDASGTTNFTYNAADQITSVTYPGGDWIDYAYNSKGQEIQMTDGTAPGVTGYTVNYQYDALGRLSELTDANGNLIASYTYDAAGRLASQHNGNSTYTNYTYDADGDETAITNYAANGSVQSYNDYTYNAQGEPINMTTTAGTFSYGYDADGQLTSVQTSGGTTITYQYDAAGNRVSAVQTGAPLPAGVGEDLGLYTTDNMNQYTAVGAATYKYDADGNLISETNSTGTTTYTYNLLGQLAEVVSPTTGTTTYQYDALGNLVSQTVNGQTTHYLVDPTGLGNVVGQFNASGRVVAQYTYGNGLVSQISSSGANNYYGFDLTGNTTQLTGAGGAVLNTYSYLPFGETLASTGSTNNPFTYVGQFGVMNSSSGLYYMRNRWYDPGTGRFTQPDPNGLAGGDANLYRYVGNTPARSVDPTGGFGWNNPTFWAGVSIAGGVIAVGCGVAGALGGGGVGAVLGTIAIYYGAYAITTGIQTIANPSFANVTSGVAADVVTLSGGSKNAQKIAQGADIAVGILGPKNPAAFVNVATKVGYGISAASATHTGINMFSNNNRGSLSSRGGYYRRYRLAPLPVTLLNTNTINQKNSGDPNAIIGPSAYGSADFVSASSVLPYTIDFQNTPTATASCGEIQITQQLSANLDWSTFQLGDIVLGSLDIAIPAGMSSIDQTLDERSTLDVYVQVVAGINANTGVATWTLTALDPTTMQIPEDPLLGLLPPDTSPPEGDGSVCYTIQPKAGDTTGTVINAQASIVFDVNAPIATSQISDTLDAGMPTSSMSPLPTYSPAAFTVSWAGQDDTGGSGIAAYNVYVTDDQGNSSLLVGDTQATSIAFTGTGGHAYAFTVVAIDNVGNVQPLPSAAVSTTVDATPPTSSVQPLPGVESSMSFTVTWNGQDNSGGSGLASYSVYVSDDGASFQPWLTGTTNISAIFTGQNGHTYGFYSVAVDNVGNRQAAPATANTTTLVETIFVTTPGVFNPANSAFYLKESCCAGAADATVCYGPAGSNWEPIVGNWSGDGLTTLGLYEPSTGTFYLKNSDSAGAADMTFNYGPGGQGWLPLAGDWSGNGTTTVGLYNPATGTFYLKNTNSAGPADLTFIYGVGGLGWLPIAGDWDGNGTTTVGLYNPVNGMFFLKDTNSAGPADMTFIYGPGEQIVKPHPGIGVDSPAGSGGQGWLPLAGDWDGKGTTTVGLYNPVTGTFYLKDSNSAGPADLTFNYGPGGLGWTPLVGCWICPDGEPLRASAGSGATPALVNADTTGLTTTAMEPIVQAAIARWAAAGASSTTLAQMANAQIVMGDLPYGELAQETAGQIIIDRTAAGYGWFVDPTPGEDQEFAPDASDAQLHPIDPRVVDQMDLLTVVEHELGIVAGLQDLDSSNTDLMSGQLATGIRRVPTAADVDAIFAADGVS